MTPQQINMTIAKKLGWKPCHMDFHPEIRNSTMIDPFGETKIPHKYASDLNAVRDVEMLLTDDERMRYQSELWDIVKHDKNVECWHLIHATAKERCIALLYVWKLVEKVPSQTKEDTEHLEGT